MGKFIIILGKSSTGKDTIFKRLQNEPELVRIIPYTTRPIRDGEVNGVDYFFVDDKYFEENISKVIEKRTYKTIKGDWTYGELLDEQIDLKDDTRNYLFIATLEGYESFINYFGKESVIPIYIDLPDGIRLERALSREKCQKSPNYLELCRRFIADSKDFSENNLKKLNITKHFVNDSLERVLEEITKYLSDLGVISKTSKN